jgi:hypothetical protein
LLGKHYLLAGRGVSGKRRRASRKDAKKAIKGKVQEQQREGSFGSSSLLLLLSVLLSSLRLCVFA